MASILTTLASCLEKLSDYQNELTSLRNVRLSPRERLLAEYFCLDLSLANYIDQEAEQVVITTIQDWEGSPLIIKLLVKGIIHRLDLIREGNPHENRQWKQFELSRSHSA